MEPVVPWHNINNQLHELRILLQTYLGSQKFKSIWPTHALNVREDVYTHH